MHSDMNYFKLYDLNNKGINVQAPEFDIPQMIVFLNDTKDEQYEFYLVPHMRHKVVWVPIIKVCYQF